MTVAVREIGPGVGRSEDHPTILIIDGDRPSRDSMAATLSVEGFDVVVATGGDDGVALARSARPSLVLLDMELSDAQGFAVFRRISAVAPGIPVIMVTSRDDELDAVLALEAGAADHITKPPRPREMTARIRAVLRRVDVNATAHAEAHATAHTEAVEPPPSYRCGPVQMDLSLRETIVGGRLVELSRKEFDLLALLVARTGSVVTRAQCMEHIWRGRKATESRTLDTHVKRLRKKIELDPADPRHLVTVRGIGYRFKP